VALLLLVVFHRPLLIALVHAIAVKVAATQNIQLSLRIEGSIFTNLSLLDIHAVPNGRGPTPVEDISIQEITAHYSIPALLHSGMSEFLSSYVLRNGTIKVQPVAGSPEQKSDLASTLHGLIQQPALFSNHVELDNLNLVAHVPDGEFALTGLTLVLDPVLPGALDIAELEVPKIRTWHNLHAAATYANRDMILTGLELDPRIVVQRFELDASRRAEGINRLEVEGVLFGGDAQFSLLVKELPGKHANNASNASAQIDTSLRDLSVEKVGQYFHVSSPAIGLLNDAEIHLTGDPNTPSSWNGALFANAGKLRAGGVVLDKTETRLDASRGWATFSSTVLSGSNSVTAQAAGKLPDSLEGFAGAAINGWFDVSGNDLHHLAAAISTGNVAGDGTFDLSGDTLRAGLDMKASGLSADALQLPAAEVKASLTKHFPPPSASGTGTDASPLEGLTTAVTLHATGAQAAGWAVDSADAAIQTDGSAVRLTEATVQRAQNSLSASGSCALPSDPAAWMDTPASLDFSLHAPSLAAFSTVPGPARLDGTAEAAGTLANGPGGCTGAISAQLSGLRMQGFAADGLKTHVTIARSVATIDTFTFALNPTDGFSATGHAGLRSPYPYDGSVRAQIRDLSRFQALAPALHGGLGGALQLAWDGQGDLSTLRSSGSLSLSVTNGILQPVRAINVAIDGTYSPAELHFPTFAVASSVGGLSAVIDATHNQLRVDQLAVALAGRPVLTGSLSFPLDLSTPADPRTLVPADGAITADLASGDVPIASLFPAGKSPAKGTIRVGVTARGSVNQPDARVIITGRALQAGAAATLAPAALDADFTLLGPQLSLKARVTQPDFSPVEIAGTIPLPLRQILRDGKLDPQSPVQLSVRVQRTSVSAITRLAPAIRYLEGTAEASLDLAGTVGQPRLSGDALLDLPAIRLRDPAMPAVNGFRGDLRFTGTEFTIREFSGQLSGGTFGIAGTILFKDFANPSIDLRLQSHEALVLRNDSVTVRANSDVRVTGPLAAASVTGDIGITQSRFFKDIDLLPLELPGHPPPPAPPLPATTPGIDTPPLRDWKFALKIHTLDPFLIHGNLANGSALVDLSVGGTGKAPTLEGTVKIENFVASLPFSKLNITNGLIFFTKDDPFIPQLNIQANSTLQDYNISVYIFGTAQEPKTVMSSEPPLRQEDIVSLLATGATTANLNSGTGIAGRAAVLLLQSLYHKVFKTKPQTDNESFASRFKVNVGGVDARTGQQEISSSFKLTDQLFLIGDIDVGGDLRGMIRFLKRFQ